MADIRLVDADVENKESMEKLISEDVMIQEGNWLEEAANKQREAEDKYREELIEKQKILEEKRREQASTIYGNKQLAFYNEMHEREQTDLIYSLNGLSNDKIEGMKEYKNALYQGAQIILFLTGVALLVYEYVALGLYSEIFLMSLALFATQIALMPKGKSEGVLDKVCKVLGILPVPAMGVLLASTSLAYIPQTMVMEIEAIAIVALSLVASLSLFIRNPYRSARGQMHKANAELKELKKSAVKAVKHNTKARQKLEAKQRKEEEKAKKVALKLELEEERRKKSEELLEAKRATREKYKELYSEKIINFKERLLGVGKKKEEIPEAEDVNETEQPLNEAK